MTIDFVLKMFEPDMESFEELSTSYILKVGRRRVMLTKEVVNGIVRPCSMCGDLITLRKINNKWIKFADNNELHYDAPILNKRHEHKGTTLECSECKREFCFFCRGNDGSMADSYCGC